MKVMSEDKHIEDIGEDMVLDSSLKAGVEENLEEMLEKKKNQPPAKKAPKLPWKMSEASKENITNAVAMMNTEYGLYATIP